MKTHIKNARIINPAQKQDFIGDLVIVDDTIEYIGESIGDDKTMPDVEIDAKGLILAPGLVDMHVHLRDPGQTHKEDIITAGKAAAAGGVTSVLAMPNTTPTIDSKETINYIIDKAKNADTTVYIAASITKGLKGEELTDIEELKRAGAIALSDDGRPVMKTAHLLEALKKAEELGIIVTAHCEDLSIAEGGLINDGEVSVQLGIKGIHRASEDCGTAREIAAAASIGAKIHICHVSTKGSVEIIRAAKKLGINVTAETAPHYLLLTENELLKKDADYRMNPPLRTDEDKKEMIAALVDGTIDAIATDHAPHTSEEKSDFIKAPNGSIGMETSLSAAITALSDKLTVSEIIEKMSTNPSKILGIDAGILKIGGKADIVIFSESEKWTVDENKLHGKSKNTPFKGMELTGKVKYTFHNGKLVYQDK